MPARSERRTPAIAAVRPALVLLTFACAGHATPSGVTLIRDGDVTIVDIQGQNLTFTEVGEFTKGVAQLAGPWTLAPDNEAYGDLCAWAYASTPHQQNTRGGDLALAYISPRLRKAGRYRVEIRWCDPRIDRADALEVRIHAKAGEVYQWTLVDQRQRAGEWHSLGTFYVEEDGELTVSNWDGSVTLDALRFSYVDDLRTPATSPAAMPSPPMPTATPQS